MGSSLSSYGPSSSSSSSSDGSSDPDSGWPELRLERNFPSAAQPPFFLFLPLFAPSAFELDGNDPLWSKKGKAKLVDYNLVNARRHTNHPPVPRLERDALESRFDSCSHRGSSSIGRALNQ